MQQLIRNSLGPKGQTIIRVVFYTYTVLLFVITLFPLNMFRGSGESWLNFLAFSHSDKLIHFMLFLVMTVLLAMSYYFKRKLRYFAIPVMIGITIELLQHFVNTGRTFDIWDIAANTAGTATAVILFIRR
jgi:glycopeptide antibiotics resistance protein